MSLMIRIRRKPQEALSRLGRMKEAGRHGAELCSRNFSSAAERIGPAAQHTRDVTAERFMGARGWSAPRIEQAGKYVEGDLAPRVNALLAGLAHRIEPPKPRHRGRTAMLAMVAIVAAAGMAGAMMTRRNNMRMLAEDDMPSAQEETPARAHVDGQVSAP